MPRGVNQVSVFISSADVLVTFPGRRRDICGRLKVLKKTYNSNTASLKVGNWTISLSRATVDYQNEDFYISAENASGFVRINCEDLSLGERDGLKTILLTYSGAEAEAEEPEPEPKPKHAKTAKTNNENETALCTYDPEVNSNKNLNELRPSAVFADGVCRRVQSISGFMVSAAQGQAGQIDKKTEELKKQRINLSTYQPVQVLPRHKELAKNARFATGVAASITSGLVNGACSAISLLGAACGPALKAGAAKAITGLEIQKNEQDARNTVEDICNIAGGVLSSFGHILKGVEESAKIIGPSVIKYAGEKVGQQYGQDMGEVTEDVLGTAGNVATIAYHAKFYEKQVMVKGVPMPNPNPQLEDNPSENANKAILKRPHGNRF